jgi:hypothetical protein
MAGGYYNARGEFVEGHLHGGDSGTATSAINHEVDEAVARCRNGASAKREMMLFYQKYPHLKQNRWAVGEHPLSPLVNEYVIEIFGLDR